MYEIWKRYVEKTSQVIMSESKCWQSSFLTLLFDLLPPKCRGIFLSPSCIYVWNMKDVRWKLVELSCQNQCWQRSIVTLTPKSIGIFLSPTCTYVWNVKAARWKLVNLLCWTKMLIKFSCDLHLWPLNPKTHRYLPLTILYLCLKYESCTLKTAQIIVSELKCWESSVVTLTFYLFIPKCIPVGIFLLQSCIYVWNLYAETSRVIMSESKWC